MTILRTIMASLFVASLLANIQWMQVAREAYPADTNGWQPITPQQVDKDKAEALKRLRSLGYIQ